MPFLRTRQRRMVLRTGPFDDERSGIRFARAGGQLLRTQSLLGNVELTFLGHPFESLGRTLDPILAVVAVGREQPDHLIGAASGRTRNIAGSKIDSLSNGEFVLKRPLHHAKMPAVPTVPLQRPTEKPCGYIAQR